MIFKVLVNNVDITTYEIHQAILFKLNFINHKPKTQDQSIFYIFELYLGIIIDMQFKIHHWEKAGFKTSN